MKEQKWNSEDWQGRSKEQVESNYAIMDTILTIAGLAFIGWAICQVLINVFQ